MTIGIYCITEIETGKRYIGQSVDIEKRWKTHQKARPTTQFHYRVAHELIDADAKALDTLERFYIQSLDCLTPKGLNRTTGGNGKFGHCDVETRAKLSASLKGRTLSDERKAKMSVESKGRTHSNEARAKISAVRKGKALSEETKVKLSASLKGKPLSAETKAKMSVARSAYVSMSRNKETV